MELALELSDWASFEARRLESDAAGNRGIGMANYVETSTGWPLERAVMEVTPEGRVDMVMGSHSSGQGHETTFRQIGASLLKCPMNVSIIGMEIPISSKTARDRTLRARCASPVISSASRATRSSKMENALQRIFWNVLRVM